MRERPEFRDAINVLKDVSRIVENRELTQTDESVVLSCWILLTEALNKGDVEGAFIREQLTSVKCVPNTQRVLYMPHLIFFEDRPGLVDKFPLQLEKNCIPKTEFVWQAMEAAGVGNVSQIVKGELEKPVNAFEDEEITSRVKARASLIKTICESSVDAGRDGADGTNLDDIIRRLRFLRANGLSITWRLELLARKWVQESPESVGAYWDDVSEAFYFAGRNGGNPPWPAISRELAQVLAPHANIASISPGLKVVLEADSDVDAKLQLNELGIISLHELDIVPVQGGVTESIEAGVEHSPEPTGNFASPANGTQPAPSGRPPHNHENEDEDSFTRHLYDSQTINPSKNRGSPGSFPTGGPKTSKSAQQHTEQTIRINRSEATDLRIVEASELGPQGKALADEFRTMVQSDYGRRCQICSQSFAVRGGGLQVYVAHVVPPSKHGLTNHFGDLMGLCGWHFSLIRYGEWALIDPTTNAPFNDSEGREGWRRMKAFLSNASPAEDDFGNSYVRVPIRFSNVYQGWKEDPITIDDNIRYSLPHWLYLRELLNA